MDDNRGQERWRDLPLHMRIRIVVFGGCAVFVTLSIALGYPLMFFFGGC